MTTLLLIIAWFALLRIGFGDWSKAVLFTIGMILIIAIAAFLYVMASLLMLL